MKILYDPGAEYDRDGSRLKPGKPAYMGINKFKKKHSVNFQGTYNPKKKSIRGDALRQLKEESWLELERRNLKRDLSDGKL